jgi:hypothetical protein
MNCIISATIVGRLKYLKIQLPYLLKYRYTEHKHYWFMNKYDAETEQWVKETTALYPDYFEIMYIPDGLEIHEWPGFNVQSFLNAIPVNPDALYIKIDDDVVYFSDDFFKHLLDQKNNNPDSLVICPFIINNQAHAHIAQKHGMLPSYWQYIHNITWCYTGLETHKLNYFHNLEYGEALHNYFLSFDDKTRWLNWRSYPWIFDQSTRFSINCIAFSGADLLKMRPVPCDDEEYLSRTVAKNLHRNNIMVTDCMCVHFSFYNQQGYFLSKDILPKYEILAKNICN